MNGDELKAQQTKSVWTNLNPLERVSSRWHARGQGFESPYLRPFRSLRARSWTRKVRVRLRRCVEPVMNFDRFDISKLRGRSNLVN